MGHTKRFDDFDQEKKYNRLKNNKNKLDKHKKLIYNVVSTKNKDDTVDDYLDYGNYTKIKRR